MAKHGKKFRAAAEKIQAEKKYTIKEAVALLKDTVTTSFDPTVEIHIKTGANVKHADQVLRANITLPAGTGKSKRIAVFCDEADQAKATKAGADIVGAEDLIEKVIGGDIDFDIAIATPTMMKNLAKAARVLGPKGLMPSPKAGTVTPNVADAITEIKKGKMEFRTDKTAIIHSIVGKASFSAADLEKNIAAFLKAVLDNKPTGIKGTFIETISVANSMGPGILINPSEGE